MSARVKCIAGGPESLSRRRLLKLAGASGACGVLAALGRGTALAQAASNYKALVCIALVGGNDGENTLVRYDNAGYQHYASIRTPASGINIPQGQLLPVQPASVATPFGFHPSCGGFKALFDQRKLAVVANVGPLVQRVTKAGLEHQGSPQPANLFSHNDQQLAMESADYTGLVRTGWGGRAVDRIEPFNAGSLFPAMVSIGGMQPFLNGETIVPLTLSESPGVGIHGSGVPGALNHDPLREAAVRNILALERDNVYDTVAQNMSRKGIESASVVTPLLQNPASIVAPFFNSLGSSISRQLKNVALLIEGRATTGMKRQVFYVSQGGYDTHGSQSGTHQYLLGDLSAAVKAFQDAMTAIGMADSVTSFTLSDFGRAFKPAADNGTDHGWGNYGFVVGGAVRGGDIYGTLPNQTLNGPDDFGDAGRWIPSTSLDQFAAPLVRWLGVPESDMPYVLPNLATFPGPLPAFI